MEAVPAQAPGFQEQFQQFVFYAGPIIQLLFWIVLMVAAIWAVLLLKRLVDFKTGRATEADVAESDSGKGGGVSVDDFVD